MESATIWTGLGGDADFEDPANWSGGLPGVGNDGTVEGAFDVDYFSTGAMDDMSVTFGDGLGGGGGSPIVAGANLDLVNSLLFLEDLTQFTVTGRMRFGASNVGGFSQLSLSQNANLTVTGDAYLGHRQQVQVQQSGNSIFTVGGAFDLGRQNSAADSSYVMSGGTLGVTGRMRVRRSSEFHLDGGTVNTGVNLVISQTGSLLEMTNGNLNVGTNLNVNNSGQFNISGGVVGVSGNLGVNGNGSNITLSGGAVDVTNKLNVNKASTFLHTGGNLTVLDRISVTQNNSIFTLNGGTVDARDLYVTNSGAFLANSGSLSIPRDMVLESNGLFQMTGGSANVANHVSVNGASFDLKGGDFSVSNLFSIVNSGFASMTGGTLDIDNLLEIDGAGSSFTLDSPGFTTRDLTVQNNGLFTHTSGLATIERDARILSSGIYNQNANIQVGRNLSLETSGTWNANAGSLNVVGDLALLADNSVFNQGGADVKINDRLLLNTGTGSSYSLNNGTLQVANQIIATAGNDLVWAGGGIIEVHDAASFVNYDGDLVADFDAILNLELDTEFLDVSGTFTVNDLSISGYDLDFASIRTASIEVGCNLLVSTGTLAGASDISFDNFSGFDGATLINMGDSFDPNTQSVYWYDTTGNQVQVCWSLTPIPEPSGICLSMMAIAATAFRRSRYS